MIAFSGMLTDSTADHRQHRSGDGFVAQGGAWIGHDPLRCFAGVLACIRECGQPHSSSPTGQVGLMSFLHLI